MGGKYNFLIQTGRICRSYRWSAVCRQRVRMLVELRTWNNEATMRHVLWASSDVTVDKVDFSVFTRPALTYFILIVLVEWSNLCGSLMCVYLRWDFSFSLILVPLFVLFPSVTFRFLWVLIKSSGEIFALSLSWFRYKRYIKALF